MTPAQLKPPLKFKGNSTMPILRMTLLGAALQILLAGCQTTAIGGTEACSAWRSISWSSRDTPETVDGVKGNNARRAAWCLR